MQWRQFDLQARGKPLHALRDAGAVLWRVWNGFFHGVYLVQMAHRIVGHLRLGCNTNVRLFGVLWV